MLRLIGASLLTLFGIALARYLAERERRRVTVAEAYLDFLRYIRGELHAFARPLGEVYRRAENPVLEENGFLPALRAGETPGDAARRTSPKSVREAAPTRIRVRRTVALAGTALILLLLL